MPPLRSAVFDLGDFRVDPALDEISKEGETTKLEPRTMQLLVCLVERAGQVVSVEELLEVVWKDVVVSTDSVYQGVASLRRILGDDAKDPKYIANVVRRGYRLIAPVVSRTEQRAATPALPKRRPISVLLLAASAALAILVVVLAFQTPLLKKPQQILEVSSPAGNEKSVAVLPFLDLSENKDQEYFADGMSEELITALGRIPELRIPARTSSFYYKGKQVTVSEIAKSLGVGYVLEGSVRKSGPMLRTTVQLVRADNGFHLWSDTYDRSLEDVLKVQDEIAVAVVKALKVRLLAGSASVVASTVNPEVYALYLQARFLERRDASGDYVPAVAYLKRALDIDPNFASAWAESALVNIIFFDTFTSVPAKEIRRQAAASANRAIELNPNLPEAHLAMAKIFSHIDWDWSAAEAEFKSVLKIDPFNSDALLGLAKLAAISGRLDEALELCQRVIVRDPLNDQAYFSLASLQSRRGDYVQAENARRKVLELNPTGATGHFWLGHTLLAQGKASEALEEMQKEDDLPTRRSGTMLALDALGRTQEAEQLVAEHERHPEAVSANIAAFYACRKDADRAFVWLERAYAQRDYYITGIGADFCFKTLKADARYKLFLRKMKLREQFT